MQAMKTITNIPYHFGMKYVDEATVRRARDLEAILNDTIAAKRRRISEDKKELDQIKIDAITKEIEALPKTYDEVNAECLFDNLIRKAKESRTRFLLLTGKIVDGGAYYLSHHVEDMMEADMIYNMTNEIIGAVNTHFALLPNIPKITILAKLEAYYLAKFRNMLVANVRNSSSNSCQGINVCVQIRLKVMADFINDGIFGYADYTTDTYNTLVKFGLIDAISDDDYRDMIKMANVK
jgi:hypothetical protein